MMNFKKYTSWNILIAVFFLAAAGFVYFYNGILNSLSLSLIIIAGIFLISWLLYNTDLLMESVRGRGMKYSSNAILFALTIFAIIYSVNYIIYQNNREFDLTENKQYSLSSQTKKILGSLNENTEDVQVIAFFTPENVAGENDFKDMMERYKIYSKKISYRTVNPYKDPLLTKKYDVVIAPTIVFQYKENEKRVNEISEKEFTNAIKEVAFGKKKTIYFITGHGEKGFDKDDPRSLVYASKVLREDNYNVYELNLPLDRKIPENTDLLIIASPKQEYFDYEKKMLKDYIENSGKVIFMLDPDSYLFADLLKDYNIEPQKAMVIDYDDRSQRQGLGKEMPVIASYNDHGITKDFNVACVFNMAIPILVDNMNNREYRALILAESGIYSWGERDIDSLIEGKKATIKKDEDDLAAPLGMAVISESYKTNKDKNKKDTSEVAANNEQEEEPVIDNRRGKVLVLGDSDFITPNFFHLSGNGDFFMNCVNYMTGNEQFIAIRAKKVLSQPLAMTEGQTKTLLYLYFLIMPAIPIIFWIIINIRRRKRDE